MVLQQIKLFARRRADFAFETTLSGVTQLKLIRDLRGDGYAAHIFFLGVRGADLALSRVRDRVLEGGHDVPEAVVRRRFSRSIRNFLRVYRQEAGSWTLFDNSGLVPTLIACKEQGEIRIMQKDLFSSLLQKYAT